MRWLIYVILTTKKSYFRTNTIVENKQNEIKITHFIRVVE